MAKYRTAKARRVGRMVALARHRARQQGVPFLIRPDDVMIPTHCPVLGRRLRFSGSLDDSPSIDRIIPGLGYVPGNVLVVSTRANRIKSDAGVHELTAIAKFYRRLCRKGPK